MRLLLILSLFIALLSAGCGGGSSSKSGDKDSNNAPEISGTPVTFLKSGNAYTFTPSAYDADNDELVFSISNKPDWATFDTATGTLSGTPTKGFYRNIIISVSDGIDTTSLQAFQIAAPELLLLKTGQTGCWNAYGTSVSCSGTNQDGDTLSGADPDFTANLTSNTVTDNVNGILWANEASPIAQNYSTASYLCENSTLGSSLWKLPDITELEMIVNYGTVSAPYLFSTFNNYASDNYWTSKTEYGNVSYLWMISFASGLQTVDVSNASHYYRCVDRTSRSTQGIFSRDSSNGIVYDARTGLEWADRPLSSMTWTAALDYCGSMTYGGYSDWRTPNIRELNSISHKAAASPAFSTAFSYPASAYFWSSTTYEGDYATSWTVDFSTGAAKTISKTGSNYVKCVRGGE
ncbi:DUF1566 domain-containing protein [Seleniivibrio sp.]|uniref:Lcl domain-containing protein n=1 Tax=Seleniivibrio sp. TaxID=2898801 RepID=UPI0025F3BABA|nr:DUF1566 domain-containing protein [Seleniivibrio sp.]MCD8552832.1 DUF1566 domain-containing protein [Seleniivibrio sp.]